MKTNTTQINPGIVFPEALYTITALKNCLGITDATLRAARRQGLTVYYPHKQGYVLGQDWIEHVTSTGRTSTGPCRNGRPTSVSRLGEAK